MGNLPPAICIMGPTASGKTKLAINLVQQLPTEIISVDSALVYKDMNIGTAKPSPAELEMAPHRLIDFLDPAEPYSVARFREDALREMAEVTAAGKIPLLVGGTMMYFRSLLDGLSELPCADEAVRAELVAETEEKGLDAMHAQLAKVDPQAAQRIHPNDLQRIHRALEVFRITGISLSDWQARPVEPLAYKTSLIGLIPSDRSVLHERIALRFHKMLEQGLVDEVRALYERGDLNINMPSMRAVGYRQVWQHLSGEISYDEMVERGIIATRQLAKRQHTWLRSMQNLNKLDIENNRLEEEVLKVLGLDHIN